ncbi:MAG: hypothetical protein LBF97_00675 [Elusimicrobiota bacterium]|nr:hypothetical protein [Elusimicrobiota bacterium]
MLKNLRRWSLWDYPFFATDFLNCEKELCFIFGIYEKYIFRIYENVLHLVKWGFSREEAWLMPMPEVLNHIRNINQYYDRKNKAAEAANSSNISSDVPRMAETVLPQTALSKMKR